VVVQGPKRIAKLVSVEVTTRVTGIHMNLLSELFRALLLREQPLRVTPIDPGVDDIDRKADFIQSSVRLEASTRNAAPGLKRRLDDRRHVRVASRDKKA